MKDLPYKRDPRVTGHPVLEFLDESFGELSADEQMKNFTFRWYEVMRPFSTYRKRFVTPEGHKSKNTILDLRHVKDYYKDYVLERGWSEHKYVVCLDAIFSTHIVFSKAEVDKCGEKYDDGKLFLQQAEKTNKERRKRI